MRPFFGFNSNVSQFYPLLIHVYGGPNSQTVDKKFKIDFNTFLASNFHTGTLSPFVLDSSTITKRNSIKVVKGKYESFLKKEIQPPFVVLEIDVRGTGFKGNSFKFKVVKNLGQYESTDVIQVTRDFVKNNKFINSQKVSLWGWSYGGYLSSKVAEKDVDTNGETVFNAIVAVAPVIDWRFYDTMYTERYMKHLEENNKGYEDSAVQLVNGFTKRRYLVIHGTADDNVHIHNTIQLLYKFEKSLIPPNIIKSQMIADNDHGMSKTENAYFYVHKLVSDFLADSFKEVDNLKLLINGTS